MTLDRVFDFGKSIVRRAQHSYICIHIVLHLVSLRVRYVTLIPFQPQLLSLLRYMQRKLELVGWLAVATLRVSRLQNINACR